MNISLIKSLEVKPTSVTRFGFVKSEITDTQTTFLKHNNIDLVYVKTTYNKSEKDNKIRRNTTIVISDSLKNKLTDGLVLLIPVEIPISKSVKQSVIGLYYNPESDIIENPNDKRTQYKALKFKKNSLVFPRTSTKTNYGLLNSYFDLEKDIEVTDNKVLEHLFVINPLSDLAPNSDTEGYGYFKLFEVTTEETSTLFDKMETMKIKTEQL